MSNGYTEADEEDRAEGDFKWYLELLEIKSRDVGWFCRAIESNGGGGVEDYYASGCIVFGIGEAGDDAEVHLDWSATLRLKKVSRADSGTFTAILEPVFERGIARMDNIPAEYFYRQELSDYAESFGRSINLADYLRSSLPDIDY